MLSTSQLSGGCGLTRHPRVALDPRDAQRMLTGNCAGLRGSEQKINEEDWTSAGASFRKTLTSLFG